MKQTDSKSGELTRYLLPDGQIKCPKCGLIQPNDDKCASCDIYFVKYLSILKREKEKKIKQEAVSNGQRADNQSDCNKNQMEKTKSLKNIWNGLNGSEKFLLISVVCIVCFLGTVLFKTIVEILDPNFKNNLAGWHW